MFHAVRNAWARTREKRLLGLFAFEFFVVVLGVLAAQAVQSWAQNRKDDRIARDELQRLTAGYYDTRESAEIWRNAIPCLREGVTAVMRAAAAERSPDAKYLQRPRLFHTEYPDTSPDVWLRIRAMTGDPAALALADAHSRAGAMREYQRAIISAWERFKLLDPALGTVNASDRAQVRTTGIDILLALRNVDIAIVNLVENATAEIPRDPEPFDPAVDSAPAPSCEHIWRTGRIYSNPKLDS